VWKQCDVHLWDIVDDKQKIVCRLPFQDDSNAKLICAAPDMLAALNGVKEWMHRTGIMPEDHEREIYYAVEEAIGKAEGLK